MESINNRSIFVCGRRSNESRNLRGRNEGRKEEMDLLDTIAGSAANVHARERIPITCTVYRVSLKRRNKKVIREKETNSSGIPTCRTRSNCCAIRKVDTEKGQLTIERFNRIEKKSKRNRRANEEKGKMIESSRFQVNGKRTLSIRRLKYPRRRRFMVEYPVH